MSDQKLRLELRALRRDQGRTLRKLEQSPAIQAALGDPDEADLVARFDSALRSLGPAQPSQALRAAFGIDVPFSKFFKTRREDFGAQPQIDRGPETVALWEKRQ